MNIQDFRENPPKYKKLFGGQHATKVVVQDAEPNRPSIPEREFRCDSNEAKRDQTVQALMEAKKQNEDLELLTTDSQQRKVVRRKKRERSPPKPSSNLE